MRLWPPTINLDFFQVPLTLSLVTGRRLDYTTFSLECRCDWRDEKQPSLCCHFNHMFHAAACCVLKLLFLPIDIQHTQWQCRFVILETKALYSQAPRQTYIYIASTATRYQGHTRYTHASGVLVIFLEHGGGALGIFQVVSLHLQYNQFWTSVRFA